jgi:hypothetical protein
VAIRENLSAMALPADSSTEKAKNAPRMAETNRHLKGGGIFALSGHFPHLKVRWKADARIGESCELRRAPKAFYFSPCKSEVLGSVNGFFFLELPLAASSAQHSCAWSHRLVYYKSRYTEGVFGRTGAYAQLKLL